jgi:hypothetical protein
MAGTDKSRSTYRGLLLMDPRITGVVEDGNATYSTDYTQAGEAYDTPVPTVLTDDMVLQSSGAPEVAAQTFTVTTQKAGFPGRDKAKFIWSRATDAAPFGWEHPNVVAGWEAIVWTDGGSYPTNFREPDAVTLSDGTVVVVVSADSASGVQTLLSYIRDPIGGTWSAVTIATPDVSSMHPCAVVLPDDRVICFFWTEDTFTSTRSVTAYVTADAGATWALHSQFALDSLATATYTWSTRVGRLRACYLNGDIALFAWLEDTATGNTHQVFQYASADLGGSFTLVHTIDDVMYPDCVAVDGTILLGVIDQDSDKGLEFYRVGTAFQPANTVLSEVNPLAGDDFADAVGTNLKGDLTVWADEDGTVYAAHLIYNGANKEGLLWRSYDAGLTWEDVGNSALGASYGTFWVTGDSTPSYPTGLAGTHCRGSHVLLHNWVAPVGNEDDSLGVLWLGGYSTVTNPFSSGFKYRAGQVSWSEMWLPYELPSDVNAWTTTSTGAETLINGALLVSCGAAVQYYTATPTSTPEQGLILQWEMQVTAGGSTTALQAGARATIGDGSHGYKIDVRCSTTGFRVYDAQSGTAKGSGVTTADLDGSWIQFRLYVVSPSAGVGAYAVYYRTVTQHGLPRAWTLVVSGADLTDAAGATTTSVVFGNVTSSTTNSRWRHFFYTAGSLTYRINDHAQDGGQDTPTDLNGRDYAPVSVSLADGLKIRAVDGPTFLGSEWTIPSRYEYAIEKILPSVEPSPTEGWRSTADGTNMLIDFELAAGDTEPLNDTVGLYIQGHNCGQVALQKFDGGSWSNIVSVDLIADLGLGSLTYINNNGAVRPGTGTEVGNHYFQFNELAGGVVRFSANAKPRRIVGNTEGFWTATTSATTKQVTIWYEPDGTEPSSGTDLSIVPPQALLIGHLAGANFRAYRLRLGGTYTTPEGYFTVNKVVIGPVVVFGKDSDWGRKYGLEPVTTIIENANGNRRSRKMNTPRRSVELPWTDGIDQTQVSGSSAASGADYLKGTSTSGGQAIALRNDTAWQLEGVVNYTGGGHLPVVYCPKITKGTPDDQTHVLRRLSMYGRIVSDWSGEVVVGDEESSELLRVAGLTLEEEK